MSQTPLSLPFFEDRHRDLLPRFRRWVKSELSSFEASEGGDGTDARLIFQRLGAAGWLEHAVRSDAGAAAGAPDIRTVCLMREALAYSSAMADVAFSEPWLAVLPIALFGTAEQRARYIAQYCAAETLLAFALSEPEAGSDVAAISACLSPSGRGYTLDGTKTWTSNAGLADGYVVFAKLPDPPGRASITAVVVDGKRPEVSLRSRVPVLSPHTVGTLSFASCPTLPDEPTLGHPGQGYEVAMRSLELFRSTVAAACVGFARRAFDEAVSRCTQRRAFGRPIAEHQLTQSKLADMVTRIDAAALLTYQAAWSADEQDLGFGTKASMAKLFASEAAGAVIDEAVQLFGGAGVVSGTTVERLYRHVRAFRIFDGTSEIQRLIIAKSVLQS